MGNSIVATREGHVYRNPKPHLRSVVAYHPSLVLFGESEFVATFDLGQAVEALDYHTVVARSVDAGNTWNLEDPLILNPLPSTTHTIRTTRLVDGSLLGLGALHHRIDPEEGLVNRATFGFVPTDLFLVRSSDAGCSWSAPSTIVAPLVGPSWEICHPVVELSCGRWLAPTATWRGWKGDNPSGEMAVVLISDDAGKSWPTFGCSFDGRETRRSHLEQSVVQLADGRILSVSWIFEVNTGRTFPTEYSLSSDRGETFTAPFLTGFMAQTCKVIQLSDGRLFCSYRRNDKPGLWGTLAKLDGERWTNLDQASLWQGADSGIKEGANSAEELRALKFGYPSMKQLSNGDVLLLFWSQEECSTNIRWIRISLE
jgi:BNR repeat-like domain